MFLGGISISKVRYCGVLLVQALRFFRKGSRLYPSVEMKPLFPPATCPHFKQSIGLVWLVWLAPGHLIFSNASKLPGPAEKGLQLLKKHQTYTYCIYLIKKKKLRTFLNFSGYLWMTRLNTCRLAPPGAQARGCPGCRRPRGRPRRCGCPRRSGRRRRGAQEALEALDRSGLLFEQRLEGNGVKEGEGFSSFGWSEGSCWWLWLIHCWGGMWRGVG